MTDLKHYANLITARIAELDKRMHEVDHELGAPMTADMNDQAIDLEDDEVLEMLGIATQREIALLNLALERIEDGSFGICKKCEEPILEARLNAVPYAPLCKDCARQ